MKSRWSLLLALVAVAGIALAGATTIESTPSAAPAAGVGAAAAPDAAPADPFVDAAPFSTSAPEPTAPCQNYAWQCKTQGGACGPQNACHCSYDASTGWICAR